MTSHPRRRDDRTAPPADPPKQWIPPAHDYDVDRRRNRSATLPAHAYDQRSYPSHDPRYHDPRHPSRPHRQDPHYPPPASHSYHPSAHAPSTSKPYQHATRPSAQHPSAHHYPQHHSSRPTNAHPVASSSRKPPPEPPDPRISSRRPPYDRFPSSEEVPRAPARPSRVAQPSIQPSISAPPNQTFWTPPQEVPSRRHKDPYRDQERERERDRGKERERERPTTEAENRYKDRARAERHRERDREHATDVRYQDPGKSRHHDKRKEPDTEGVLYSEQRNASKASLSGKEGYASSVREPSSGHRRHRTEDGTTSTGRRHQPENAQNPITTMPPSSTNVPQPNVQQTGEPPPAPRVMPVYLPPKAKSHRSQRDGRPSTAQGAQSGSDTERASGRHRMERPPSGPAVQRSDAHTSTSTRDRGNYDVSSGTRDNVKRSEGKYGAHQDARQPLAPINVDIPLVTPGFNASSLPPDTRTSTAPQIVSIRAGQGPSDPHDAHFKSSAVSHLDASQDIVMHAPPHPTSASIIKSSSHPRTQPSEARSQYPPATVEHSRAEPRGDDPTPGSRVSIDEPSRALRTSISKSSYTRGNPETEVDIAGTSYPHSRPPSRSAHRTASNPVPSAVAGPRPLRSASQGQQTNEPSTRPPSVTRYSTPQSPSHPNNGNSPKAEHTHVPSSSAQPSPKYAQLHGVTPSHSSSAAPSVQPTPTIVPQTLTTSSRPSTRDGTHTDAPHAHQRLPDQQQTVDDGPEFRQTSNGTTVKASWIVQTPATAKRAKISREDKYLRDNQFSSETPHPQLRQMLSQDDDPFPRTSSSMMKASQAATPLTSSQRSSLNARVKDVAFGTPRGASTGDSPRPGSTKQAPTPEHAPRQNLPPHFLGLPQIAVVGATPVALACDLPQGRVDHSLLAPPFPAPTRVSRSTSGSQDKQSQPSPPTTREGSPSSYQPQLVPAVHAPSLFQPYRPPSPPAPEDGGEYSPPPLPIPPPRGLEDSPPPPIETRTSEIIPTRLQSDGRFQDHVHSIPEVQSEMFHLPSAPHHLSSALSPRVTETWQPGKVDGETRMAAALNASSPMAHGDVRSFGSALAQADEVPIVDQEIMRFASISPSQSSVPSTRPRPKVTIEDVPEDVPTPSRGNPLGAPTITPSVSESRSAQPSRPTLVANESKPAIVDQPSRQYSPQSRSKDATPHYNAEASVMSTAPPMPPPTAAAPTSSRFPSSVPLSQPTLPSSSQATTQRTAPHAVSSRTYQRAAEMLQADKQSTPSGTWSTNKSAATSTQASHNPSTANQPSNGANILGVSAPRFADMPTINAPYLSVSATSTTKAATPMTMTGFPPAAINAQAPSAPPGRSGHLPIPAQDATPTTVMSTAAAKNAQEPITDPNRPRDIMPSARNQPSSHLYPISSRPGTSSTPTQQTYVTPAPPSTHYRAVSLPVTTSSPAVQKPPSPRKYPQPIAPIAVSTQPFPSRPEPQSARAPVSGHLATPAPVRSARLSPSDRTNDSDVLKTPSSIAPSPMLNPDTSNAIPPPIAVPIRARNVSTDSKDDKRKGFLGLFRTRTLSSKATDPPPTSSTTRTSVDQGKAPPDTFATSTTVPVSRGVASASAPKGLHTFPPHVASTSTRTGPHSKVKGRQPDPITIPTQTARDQKDGTPHIFTPFKFLTMHSKRNRTVSAASLDVCDGNTATNTVIGSPDHSIVGQAYPLPAIIPPDVRDPLKAASEWRDREEAERRERRAHRIRRPGVTFDLEEEPPSPAPGTLSKRKRLVRRSSGRTPTPGPSRG